MRMRHLHHVLILLMPLVFAGCFKTRQDIAREKEDAEVRSNLQQNVMEYSQGLEKTQAELGRLQGRIEELEHLRRKDMTGLSSSREAEMKTLEELKTKMTSLQEAQNALFEEMKRLKEENFAAISRSSPPPTAPAGAKKK